MPEVYKSSHLHTKPTITNPSGIPSYFCECGVEITLSKPEIAIFNAFQKVGNTKLEKNVEKSSENVLLSYAYYKENYEDLFFGNKYNNSKKGKRGVTPFSTPMRSLSKILAKPLSK